MVSRLGKNQLDFIASMCLGRACIVGDKLLRSLAKSGCLKALGSDSDSFYVITADGLRAVADAMDRGTIPQVTIEAFKPRKAVG